MSELINAHHSIQAKQSGHSAACVGLGGCKVNVVEFVCDELKSAAFDCVCIYERC